VRYQAGLFNFPSFVKKDCGSLSLQNIERRGNRRGMHALFVADGSRAPFAFASRRVTRAAKNYQP